MVACVVARRRVTIGGWCWRSRGPAPSTGRAVADQADDRPLSAGPGRQRHPEPRQARPAECLPLAVAEDDPVRTVEAARSARPSSTSIHDDDRISSLTQLSAATTSARVSSSSAPPAEQRRRAIGCGRSTQPPPARSRSSSDGGLQSPSRASPPRGRSNRAGGDPAVGARRRSRRRSGWLRNTSAPITTTARSWPISRSLIVSRNVQGARGTGDAVLRKDQFQQRYPSTAAGATASRPANSTSSPPLQSTLVRGRAGRARWRCVGEQQQALPRRGGPGSPSGRGPGQASGLVSSCSGFNQSRSAPAAGASRVGAHERLPDRVPTRTARMTASPMASAS